MVPEATQGFLFLNTHGVREMEKNLRVPRTQRRQEPGRGSQKEIWVRDNSDTDLGDERQTGGTPNDKVSLHLPDPSQCRLPPSR